jgi:uncharacterized protein (DUF2062 family)
MPRRFFKQISTRFQQEKGKHSIIRPLEFILAHPVYFSPTRRSVGGGLWIGLFLGLLPIPGQTVLAILGAVWLRVNVPIAAVAVWVSNPVTFVPIFYLAYKIGAVLLDIPPEPFPDELSWAWLSEEIALRWKPIVLGSFILAMSVSSTVYLVVSAVWHISTIHRYRHRHRHRTDRGRED